MKIFFIKFKLIIFDTEYYTVPMYLSMFINKFSEIIFIY